MDPNSKRREDYRKHSSLNLHRNHALAADSSSFKAGNMFARFIGVIALLTVCFGVAWAAHM
ncbi:MAG: LytR family transcriptional regulator, partial [Lactobacillus acidophilus]